MEGGQSPLVLPLREILAPTARRSDLCPHVACDSYVEMPLWEGCRGPIFCAVMES